jgi:hypothetical protein
MRSESCGFERPEKSMSLPDGPRSIQRPRSPPVSGTGISGTSSPGSLVDSVVPVSTVAFLVDSCRDGTQSIAAKLNARN